MHHCYRTVLELIENHGLRMMKVDIHKQLRDLALRRNDLAEYVKHNDAVVAVTAETKGNAVAVKIAMQETERRLAEERQVHEKQLAVLHATLPKHVADRVARGETVSDHFDNAAVLFTDIAGFTTHSDVLPSYQVTALLENLFNAVAIARTALDFHQTGTSWPSGEPLTIRIGLHCGPVTAGVIGTERLQYDVWGDIQRQSRHGERLGGHGARPSRQRRLHLGVARHDRGKG
jgi:hypothetical protein